MANIDKIKALAKEKGVKQNYICAQLGLQYSYLNDVEKGKNKLTEERLRIIADILGTTPEYLKDETDVKEKDPLNITDRPLNFWEKYSSLCLLNRKSPNSVAREIGISSGTISEWKNGRTPRVENLHKIADYFGISVENLIFENNNTDHNEGNFHMSVFSEKLNTLIKESGLTQKEISERLYISRSALIMYKRGEREPNMETLGRIASFFNVDFNYLLGLSEINETDHVSVSQNVTKLESSHPLFGSCLKSVREKAGYTQQEIARKLSVSRSTLGMWEINQSEPNLAYLIKLSSILGVSTDELLGIKINIEKNAAEATDEITEIINDLPDKYKERILEIAKLYKLSIQMKGLNAMLGDNEQ